jgi:death-on-curing protein
MSRGPVWLSRQAVLAIHDILIAEHGGATGRVDDARLDAALGRPRNRHAYEDADLFQLAAAYAFGIARDHPFPDGNKRVALTLAGVFLERNGWRLGAPEAEAAAMTIALAAGDVDEAAYADWLRSSSAKRRSRRRP